MNWDFFQISFDGKSLDHFESTIFVPCEPHLYDCWDLHDRGDHFWTILCGSLPLGLSSGKWCISWCISKIIVWKEELRDPIYFDDLIVGCHQVNLSVLDFWAIIEWFDFLWHYLTKNHQKYSNTLVENEGWTRLKVSRLKNASLLKNLKKHIFY